MSLRNLLLKLLGASKAIAGAAVTVGSTALTISTSVLSAALILYSSYVLYDTVSVQNNARANTAELIAFKPEEVAELDMPVSALADVNSDYTGWLTLNDTEIDYPVMQGDNDIFYAFHDIYKNESQTGSIYLSASNAKDYSENYNLIYGHDMAAGMMFGGLHKYLREDGYLDAHKTGVLISRDVIYDLEVFAAILTDAYEANVYSVGNRDLAEVMAYIDSLPDEDKVISPALPENADKILALSTCASGAATYGRIVVFATMTVRPVITLEVEGYEGVYDGQEHYAQKITTNITDGVTITYSYDDGVTWTEEAPSIQNVGEKHFQVCAYHERYGLATATASLKVTPKQVTVTADPAEKMFDTPDPTFTATFAGLLEGDRPEDFAVSFTRESGEDVGTYPVTPTGDAMQGNYELVFVPGNLTIVPSDVLRVTGIGYTGTYDGQPHTVSATYNTSEVKGDILIEYSLDGEYWTTDPMEFASTVPTNVTVKVRGTSENYVTSESTAVLNILPREIRAVVNNTTKVFGADDPDFTVTYEGLLPVDSPDDFTVTFSREPGEQVGTYTVTAHGDPSQGSYHITFVPGTLEITPSDTLAVAVTDINGTYTGQPYYSTAVANITEGTTIKYSDDGGKTWHTDPSAVAQTDAGSKTVLVRAENPNYTPYETSYEIHVSRAPVTISVHKEEKVYGSPDPEEYPVTISGVLDDGFVPEYTIVRTNAGEENAGFYPGVLDISGETIQGNYEITFVDGDFEILKAKDLSANAEGYDGVYDGYEHSVSVTPKINGQEIDEETAKDLEIWYSTDGGETWTKDVPSVRNANTYSDDDPGLAVMVKVTHPNYEDAVETVYLKVDPKTVVVKADTVRVEFGARNPEFTATVSGLLDGDTIEYTIECTTSATAVGYYTDVIVPKGEERQGNYRVRYIPGDLIIYDGYNPPQPPPDTPGDGPDEPDTPTPGSDTPDPSGETPAGSEGLDQRPNKSPDTSDNSPYQPSDQSDTPDNPPEENHEKPIVNWIERFKPAGNDTIHGGRVWALVNLLCVLVTLYLFLPLLHLRAKFSRRRLMKKVNEEKEALLTLQELQEEEERERERIERYAVEERQNGGDPSAAAGSEAGQPSVTREEFDRAVDALYYRIRKFTRRFWIGIVLEFAVVVLAAVVFYLTEDMRLPMVLIDKWTPLMILLLALCWIVDIRLARYRSGVLADEEEEIEEQTEELKNTAGAT